MKRLILLITFLSCIMTAQSQENKLKNLDSKNGFNNLKFRTSIEDVKKTVNLKKVSERQVNGGKMDYYIIKNADHLYTFGNYKVKNIAVGFFNMSSIKTAILAYIEVNLVDSKYLSDSQLLNDMVIAEYGRPTSTQSEGNSFELRQNRMAYIFDWQGKDVLLRLIRWNIPIEGAIMGNTYRYYDVGIYNSTTVESSNGF